MRSPHRGPRARALVLPPLVAALAACASPADRGPTPEPAGPAAAPPTEAVAFDFEDGVSGRAPRGFTLVRTGGGAPSEWVVEAYPATSGNVVAQRSTARTRERTTLCVLDGYTARDFTLRAELLLVSGDVDRAAGLVARLRDEDDHLLVRASALDGSVRLYAVVGGERRQLAAADVDLGTGQWHELRLDARGASYAVFLDGRQLFTATDVTFLAPGSIGLWTAADSVARFDELSCGPLDRASPLGG